MGEVQEIDLRRLTNEILEVMMENGLEEPWLMALVDRLVRELSDVVGDVSLYCGKRDGEDFVGFDIGLLSNVFSYESGELLYYIVSNITGSVERIARVKLDEVDDFAFVIETLFRYLGIQLKLEGIYNGGGDLDEFDKLINELL